MEFYKKNFLELRKMAVEELSKYYMEKRKWEYENNVPLKNIELRNKIHSLLVLIVKIDRILNNEKIKVIKNESTKDSKPIIYTCTHIGGHDVERTFEAIKRPAYLFLGDPKDLYKDFSGLLLYLNGVLFLETNNKEDRKIAKERSIEVLKNGGNLLIYPEGAWNISPNLPVMDLYHGASIMAKETNALIVPVAIEQYNNEFIVSIGKNLDVSNIDNYKDITQIIRDKMATEKWNIWASRGVYSRNDIKDIKIEDFQKEIISKCEYDFTIEEVVNSIYYDKNKVSYDEAFSFIKRLK